MKKSSSRSQRGSKGIKGKHVLQICVLLGVCIWLIYQVKYSHDKKKEFYEKDGEKSSVLLSEREDGLVKLGRKDLLPGYHNNKNEKEKHVEEEEEEDEEVSHGEEGKEGKSKVEEEKEEEEEVVEDDEEDKSKQGEEVAEEDEDEGKHEDDEIDEQDQSKSEGENDKDDELVEEDKESDEKGNDSNHVDEIDMTVHEAREEHYKADDASSAVSHESRALSTEKIKEGPGNATELAHEKMKEGPGNATEVAQENNSNATTSEVELQKEPGQKLGEVESGSVVGNTTTEGKDGDGELSNSERKSAVTVSTGETVKGNLTEAILEASNFLQNETEIMQARSQEDGAPPVVFSNLQTVLDLEQTRNESVSNVTVSADSNVTVSANITDKDSIQVESRNITSESSLVENISGSNTTEVKENSRSEGDDESAEKESSNLNSTDQTEEAEDTPERSLSEEEKEADDTQERSISDEEREALIDPQTLPDIRIEGNEEDEEEAIGAE